MQRCESGKVRHSSPARAKVAAHAFARALNADRKVARNIYAYRCAKCRGGWHLTRQAGWPGVVPVFKAPPEELQRWTFPALTKVQDEGA